MFWSMFQSALRMRGLFNLKGGRHEVHRFVGFNPPCGCVAFSTDLVCRWFGNCPGFNPPCGCVAFSTGRREEMSLARVMFQSALRMRGLFNSATS